jgi:hypothetical protein
MPYLKPVALRELPKKRPTGRLVLLYSTAQLYHICSKATACRRGCQGNRGPVFRAPAHASGQEYSARWTTPALWSTRLPRVTAGAHALVRRTPFMRRRTSTNEGRRGCCFSRKSGRCRRRLSPRCHQKHSFLFLCWSAWYTAAASTKISSRGTMGRFPPIPATIWSELFLRLLPDVVRMRCVPASPVISSATAPAPQKRSIIYE